MLIKRKVFLQIGSMASASIFLPKFLRSLGKGKLVPPGNKVLVVLQMSGGNDGLNTIIPVRNDIYYKGRRGIGISKNDALALTDDTGLHPALTYFKELYDDGSLGILNNVGYPNPDHSHFRSMDIWQTASDSNQYLTSGWIGRYLDAQCKDCGHPTQALEIDDILSLAMKGEDKKGLALTDPKKLFQNSNEKFFRQMNESHTMDGSCTDYLYKVLNETLSSADYIYEQSNRYRSTENYPNSSIGKNLRTIASLILSDINTRVYYVSIGSFDTHVNQAPQQKRLFTDLNNALKPFFNDLKKNGRFEDVVLMTFSEFGRRVSQNASGGTDHGTANCMFLAGGGLKQKGLINGMPDLENLDNGDMKFSIDFRTVYATLLHNWLGANDTKILGKDFSRMEFV